jgi:hypothetical protein
MVQRGLDRFADYLRSIVVGLRTVLSPCDTRIGRSAHPIAMPSKSVTETNQDASNEMMVVITNFRPAFKTNSNRVVRDYCNKGHSQLLQTRCLCAQNS